MASNRNNSVAENPTSMGQRPFPFLGVLSLTAGAIIPGWVILATIIAGPEAAGWLPFILILGMPYNLLTLALFLVAAVCGIYAQRNAKVDRVLGRFGLILAGLQLLYAFPLVWSFITSGG